MEHGFSIWFPVTKLRNDKLEKIPKMALRLILNKYGSSIIWKELRHRGKIQPLQVKAAINRPNIVNGTVHIDEFKYLTGCASNSVGLNNVKAIKLYCFKINVLSFCFCFLELRSNRAAAQTKLNH